MKTNRVIGILAMLALMLGTVSASSNMTSTTNATIAAPTITITYTWGGWRYLASNDPTGWGVITQMFYPCATFNQSTLTYTLLDIGASC